MDTIDVIEEFLLELGVKYRVEPLRQFIHVGNEGPMSPFIYTGGKMSYILVHNLGGNDVQSISGNLLDPESFVKLKEGLANLGLLPS